LGCCLNHSTTAICTLSSEMKERTSISDPKMWKSYGSPSSMQDVWAPLITWNSVDLMLCGARDDVHHCAKGWCHQWGYLVVCYWLWYADSEVSESNGLQSLHHILKCGNKDLSMAFWSCMDGPTTQYTIFKRCLIVTHISHSPNWLNCYAQVPASVFNKSKTQVCHHTPAWQSYEYISAVYFKISACMHALTYANWAVCNSTHCRSLHVHLLQIQTYRFIGNENIYHTTNSHITLTLWRRATHIWVVPHS
jgi:hypothetical protein